MLEKSTISFIMKLEKRDGGCEVFDIMTMAENIKTYRNKRGLNQYEFAEKLGISPQAVCFDVFRHCHDIKHFASPISFF